MISNNVNSKTFLYVIVNDSGAPNENIVQNNLRSCRPNLSGSHTFSLTATAEIGRNVIFKAKRK